MNTDFGNVDQIRYPVMENFDQISPETGEEDLQNKYAHLQEWSSAQLDRLDQCFRQRKQQGFIQECHGDMHLSNMVLINDKVVIFDCIEFDETFRRLWIPDKKHDRSL